MYNRPPMTVNPVYSDSATGQQVVDLEIQQTGHSAVGRDGQYRGWQDDWTSDSQGRSVYDPKDGFDELGQSPVVGFNEDEYTEALLTSNPDIPKALEFAVDFMPEEFVDEYNNAVDSGNLDKMHQMLDVILEQYHQHNPQDTPEDEPPTEEPLSDEESTEFAHVLDDLTEQQPAGTESAYMWLEASQQWESDPVMSAVCRATASFHDGSSSAEDLIDSLTAKFTPRELARAYQFINNNG